MRQFLNGFTLANDVRMRRSIWKGAFLFVEGVSDERLYGVFADPASCQIVVAHGRSNLLEACEILNIDSFEGFLGILDADFGHVRSTLRSIPNLLFTDFHDAECFMLRGAAFERVLLEFASKDKLDYWSSTFSADIRQHLLTQSASIGFLLWHSLEKDLNLKFTNLETKEYTDRESIEVNIIKLIEHAKNKSQKYDLRASDIIREIDDIQKANPELWQVVRGPDFIDLLGYALRFALATWSALDVTASRLEQSLRIAYPAEEFAATGLYKAIRGWEKASPPYVILKVLGTGNLFDN